MKFGRRAPEPGRTNTALAFTGRTGASASTPTADTWWGPLPSLRGVDFDLEVLRARRPFEALKVLILRPSRKKVTCLRPADLDLDGELVALGPADAFQHQRAGLHGAYGRWPSTFRPMIWGPSAFDGLDHDHVGFHPHRSPLAGGRSAFHGRHVHVGGRARDHVHAGVDREVAGGQFRERRRLIPTHWVSVKFDRLSGTLPTLVTMIS